MPLQGYIWPVYVWLQMSSWPDVVLLLATGYLYWGVTFELRSTGPKVVPLLTMRCLYWGVGYVWARYICLESASSIELLKIEHEIYVDVWLQMSCWPDVVLDASTMGVHLTNVMAYSVEAFQCNLPPQLQMNRKVLCVCKLLFFDTVVVVVVVVLVVVVVVNLFVVHL